MGFLPLWTSSSQWFSSHSGQAFCEGVANDQEQLEWIGLLQLPG